MITKTEIRKYVTMVGLKEIYEDISDRGLGCEDTLSDEFQILSELENVFTKYAERYEILVGGK